MAVLIKGYYVSKKLNLNFFQSKITFTKSLANPMEKYKLHSILRLMEKQFGGGGIRDQGALCHISICCESFQ